MTSEHAKIVKALELINEGIEGLKSGFPYRKFTIDGRLVGDIGEIIAEIEYDIVLDKKSRSHYDAVFAQDKNIQVKATFKDSLTFKTTDGHYLGFKIGKKGDYETVFNGPASHIYERYKNRKGIGEKLLSFPVKELKALNDFVRDIDRIPKRILKPTGSASPPPR